MSKKIAMFVSVIGASEDFMEKAQMQFVELTERMQPEYQIESIVTNQELDIKVLDLDYLQKLINKLRKENEF